MRNSFCFPFRLPGVVVAPAPDLDDDEAAESIETEGERSGAAAADLYRRFLGDEVDPAAFLSFVVDGVVVSCCCCCFAARFRRRLRFGSPPLSASVQKDIDCVNQ